MLLRFICQTQIGGEPRELSPGTNLLPKCEAAFPVEEDLLAHAERGRPCPSRDPRVMHEWEGLSVFETYEQARANAMKWKWRIGEYVAELSIPDGIRVIVEGPDARG